MTRSLLLVLMLLGGCAHLSWVPAFPEGHCPREHPVKGNMRSGFYHLPTDIYYARVSSNVQCFASARSAAAEGLTPANPRKR